MKQRLKNVDPLTFLINQDKPICALTYKNKLLTFLLITLLPSLSHALDLSNPNDENMKRVNGTVISIEYVDFRPIIQSTGNEKFDSVLESIRRKLGTNYVGVPIYQVKVNDDITLEVGSDKKFQTGDCVLIWYDKEMGNSPNLSIVGQAGISKSKDCLSD